MAAAGAAALVGEEEVQIIDPSPTDFNPQKMPRTVAGNTFIRAVDQAYHCRVLISKLIAKGDAKIEELGILEEEREEGESEDEEFLELQKDLLEDVEQMKKKVKEHFTVTHEIGCMASFIVRTRPDVQFRGTKSRRLKQHVTNARRTRWRQKKR